MKKIALLGSTGSIGEQTIDVVKQHPEEYEIIGLSANKNYEKIIKQAKELHVKKICLFNEEAAEKARKIIKEEIDVLSGMEGMKKIAGMKQAKTTVIAVVGNDGIEPTYEAIKKGKEIALANKETLVSAGYPIMKAIKKEKIKLMPIDSEHSAIFQCLNGENKKEIKKIIITCSGGSFRGKTKTELKNVTKKEALNHPTWNMGGKITIDSATLMNKGFEVIEAHYLYDVPYEQIEVVVHPQSIIHSAIEYKDGSVISQIGYHDMRIPIQYALSYPKRINNSISEFDFTKIKEMTFEKPDTKTFEALKLAIESGKKAGTMTTVLNSANDVAVEAFLKEKIKFLEIAETVKKMLKQHEKEFIEKPTIKQVLKISEETKQKTKEKLGI